ncbi:hypothetical protein ACOZ4Y_01350 [Komagataeibacter rhaeticus]|uniref:hypothetical protein n=2 Tax=Komagataeibacter rhaeticus TaxID=215221 RepID=UPI000AF47FB7|nr:hypothetical protein [Komagataeibacter rhaeticus]
MRNAMLLSLLLCLAGCGGFGKILSDNTELPGSLPNTPRTDVENMRRVAGRVARVPPIVAQEHNIWPVLPSGQMALDAIGAGPDGPGNAAARSRLVEREVDLPAGGEMQIGNDPAPDGMQAEALPVSALPLAGEATHKGVSDSTIIVPNGDGTSTLVGADGTVHEQQAP